MGKTGRVGYTVEYSASNPAGFVYNAEKKLFKNANPKITSPFPPQTEPGYKIQVTLNRHCRNSPFSETFTIKVVGNTSVDIDTDNLKITDINDYSPRRPLLLFNDPIAFLDDGNGVLIANVQVPYTSFDTKLKVEVQALVEETQGKDEGVGGANWSNPSYKKEYEITIGNLSSNLVQEIKFSITSKANSSIKNV